MSDEWVDEQSALFDRLVSTYRFGTREWLAERASLKQERQPAERAKE